jgi:hypothetical protein
MQEFIDTLQNMGALLGFASAGIAWAYVGSFLASLLCVGYGLLLWNQGRRVSRVQSSRRRGGVRARGSSKGWQVKKGRGPRRRRSR